MRFSRIAAGRLLGCFAILLATGCSGGFANVSPTPPASFTRLGPAQGSACGSLLLGPTAYNFIPLGLGDRVERAYGNAVNSVEGATSLVDVSIQESWFWWVIGSTRCISVTGEAIK